MWRLWLGNNERPTRRRHRCRALGFEQFEPRQMMAVTTSLVGGSLTITGDAAADDIAIVGTERPGELTITGRNGTTINGILNGSVTIPGVTARLAINSGDGDDVISFDHVYTADSITISTDAGDDQVTLGANGVVSSRRSIIVSTGNGNDQVQELNYAVLAGDSNTVNLGDGDDVARIVGASATGSFFDIIGSRGNDSILVIGVTAKWDLSLSGATGIDSVALVYSSAGRIRVACEGTSPSGGGGNETLPGGGTIYIDTVYSKTLLRVTTRSGSAPAVDSSISVYRCLTTRLEIDVGAGNNRVHVYGNAATGPTYAVGFEIYYVSASLSIYLERSLNGTPFSNRNVVEVAYNVSPVLGVYLGDGNDMLSLAGNLITSSADFDGLGGINRLFELGNLFASSTRRNFLP